MLAPKARAKILRYFARKQPVTSPFSNSRGVGGGELPQVTLLSGRLAKRTKPDKFGNFPILEKLIL